MNKMKSKSLSVFIVLCLLLTGLFNNVSALPQALNTETADEHDGHTHVDSESLKEEVQIEQPSEESLRIIDDPVEPPIDEPGSTYCSHYWTYTDLGFNHAKTCVLCGVVEYQKHTKKYISQGAHYHSERCQYCSFNLLTPHIESGMFISDGGNGHHLNCGKCGAPCATLKHTLTYLNNGTSHSKKCMFCSYSTDESHTFGPWIPGGISHERRCNLCNALQSKSHSLKYYSTGLDYHSKTCTVCGYAGQEIHSYKATTVGTDDHTLKCTKCNQQKTESHTLQWTSDGASGHHKACVSCGKVDGTTTPHNLTYTSQSENSHSAKCPTCSYSTTQSHNWDGVTVNTPYPHQHCIQCGQDSQNSVCQHSNLNAIEYDDYSHMSICSDCSENIGLEPHLIRITDLGNGKFDNYCAVCGFTKITSGIIPK